MPIRIGSKRRQGIRRTFLKEYRNARGLTLEAAASRFDMSAGQLSRLENGKSDVTLGFLDWAADEYGTTVNAILHRNPLNPEDSPAAEVAAMVDDLKPREQRQAVEMIRVIAGKRKTG